MTNPVTPNIGLNKIDRTSPATTYFDLEKYIDQNADTVDRFAGEASQAIEALQQRLDTEERREVVLQPGLQIVNAERSAPFSLSGIKGRTLVNLLGRDGRFLSTTPWINYGGTIVTSNEKLIITGNGSSSIPQISNPIIGPTPSLGEVYLLRIRVSITAKSDKANYLGVYLYNTTTQVRYGENYEYNPLGNREYELCAKLVITQEVIDGWKSMSFISSMSMKSANDANGAIATFSEAALYKITNADQEFELAHLKEMYPFTTGIASVKNPYVIRYGENLLPSFYEAKHKYGNGHFYISPYEAGVNASDSGMGFGYELPSIPGITYTLSDERSVNSKIALQARDSQGNILTGGGYRDSDTTTITTPEGTTSISVILGNGFEGAQKAIFKNPMLNIGSTPKLFKPREDSMLALQTGLYADPVTGANADEVFEMDGQYFKHAKWKQIVLDGSHTYAIDGRPPGYKILAIRNINAPVNDSATAIKFNGDILSKILSGSNFTGPDQQVVSGIYNGNIYNSFSLTISNEDSGWGNNYTPTLDEIRSYFMGWTMYDGTGGGRSPNDNLYDGTGTKWWARRSNGIDRIWVDATNILPTEQAPNFIPYQLVYQLTTPTIEPIVSEGTLTFKEGDNLIEVGTGIILRENAPILKVPGQAAAMGDISAPSAYRIGKFIRGYKDDRFDPLWYASNINPYGSEKARIDWGNFSESNNYSMTYQTLDKFPTTPFSGSYPKNEKAILQELADTVQQNTSAVSFFINKKSVQATPRWITPTLLNGWIDYGGSFASAAYYKDSTGIVHLKGLVKSGTSANNTVIFRLPEGYRPSHIMIFQVASNNGSTNVLGRADVTSSGEVLFNSGGNIWFSLNEIKFLAEQ